MIDITKPFPKEEMDLIITSYQTQNNIQIAQSLNRSPKQISDFLYRHHLRRDKFPMNKEWANKISMVNKGKSKSEDHKRKLSLITKRQFQNGMPKETKMKLRLAHSSQNNYFYGKHHTTETRNILRQQKLGIPNPKHSETLKRLYSECKIISWNKGKHGVFSEETRKRMSQSIKAFGFFRMKNKDPEFIQKRLRGLIRKPTNPELRLKCLLDANFPNEWKYVGDGQIIIDNLNPDFININGKKLIIEVFGDYWHRPDSSVVTKQEREERFAKYGYRMMVVWESDLMNETNILDRIRCF